MKLVTIHTFQKITGLSDRAMLQLLERVGNDPQHIYGEIHPDHGIVLDVNSVRVRDLVEALKANQQSALEAKRSVIVEKLGSIIVDEIEDIFLEATAKASAEQSTQKED